MADVRFEAARAEIAGSVAVVYVDYDNVTLRIQRVGVVNDAVVPLVVGLTLFRGGQELARETVVAPGDTSWNVPGNHDMLNEPHPDGGPTIRPPFDYALTFEVSSG